MRGRTAGVNQAVEPSMALAMRFDGQSVEPAGEIVAQCCCVWMAIIGMRGRGL
jgi:hypothetical protein